MEENYCAIIIIINHNNNNNNNHVAIECKKGRKKKFLVDMACPCKNNVDAQHEEKLQKY